MSCLQGLFFKKIASGGLIRNQVIQVKNESECHSHMFTRPIFQKITPALLEESKLHTKNDSECHYHMFTTYKAVQGLFFKYI